MIIDSTIKYINLDLSHIVSFLLNLPQEYLPVWYKLDEVVNSKKMITSEKDFEEFIQRNSEYGFSLYNDNIEYDLKPARDEIWIRIEEEYVTDNFLNLLLETKPYWGYFADFNEIVFRNKIVKKIGNNSIETWIGRDIMKYLPGLYWINIISNEAFEKFKLNFDNLSNANSKLTINHKYKLLKLYEKANDWYSSVDLTNIIYDSQERIFDKRFIENKVESVDNYVEYKSILKDFK